MGFLASLKGNQAMKAHNKGDYDLARKLYEEAIGKGCMEARVMLSYAVLLIRAGEYDKAKDLLIKAQKSPDLTPDRKSQLFVNYAACCSKTGQLEKGIRLLERQHANTPTGLTYQTLGYLYVVRQAEGKPVADERTEVKLPEGMTMPEGGLTVAQKQEILDQQWAQSMEKTEKMLADAIDYDDEDPVCLDNMGQYLYRVKGDKDAAKEWFEKALKEKPNQIDSLWFLSRYDVEDGKVEDAVEKLETAAEGRFSPLNYVDKATVEAEIARLKK